MYHRTLISTLATVTLATVTLVSCATAQDKPKSEIPADTKIETTESGLKYSVLKAGDGKAKPQPGDRASVHYTGWLTDGTQFDSSRGGSPFTFTVGQGVIKGWSEGVQHMTKGGRFKFTIPSDLGYGDGGRPPIPPKATLIFDVELISITSIPKFKQANPANQKTTESGIRYEELTAGKGDLFKKDQIFKLSYAIFNDKGRLMECTEQSGRDLTGTIDDMALPFLKEAPLLLNQGARFRFEVPQKLGIPQIPGTTVWELELLAILKPLPIPEFKAADAEKTKTTASGLQYEIIKEGDGASPTAADSVTVHYAGWLTDGTLFDASFKRGEPSSFPLRGVIRGWTEGIPLMKMGSVYRFTIPGNLAYGPQGKPPQIKPNATLVFQVELLEIN